MEYKQKKLSELVNGEAFEGFLLVKSAAVRTGSTGKNYLDLSLADDKTAINAKAWDYYDAVSHPYHAPCGRSAVLGVYKS